LPEVNVEQECRDERNAELCSSIDAVSRFPALIE